MAAKEREGAGQQEGSGSDREQQEEGEEEELGLGAFFDRQAPPPAPLPRFDDDGGSDNTSNAPAAIELRQDSRSALGGRVWCASLFLLRWLRRAHGPAALAGAAVLDVGAGIGVLGLACACAAAPPRAVVLTDQDCLLPLLEANAATVRAALGLRGSAPRVAVHRLDWLECGQGADTAAVAALATGPGGDGGGGGGFDWILVADCVYYQHLFAPLVATLAALAGGGTRVVVCNDDGRTSAAGVEAATGERWDAAFFRLLALEFEVEEDRVYPVGGALGLDGGPYRVVVCRHRRPRGGCG